MRRIAPAAVAALLLGLVLTACGDGDRGAAPTTATPPDPAGTTTPEPSTTTPSPTVTAPGDEPTTSTSTSSTTTTRAPLAGLAYETVATGLPFPTDLDALAGSDWAFVTTKDGRVWRMDGRSVAPEPVLDLSDAVRNQGEQGLLSLAFHPEDPGRIFLHYSAVDGDTVLSEFSGGPDGIDRSSERVLLRLDQPAANHNGGPLLFDPEGRLLVGLGDGGGSGDRFGNGQDPSSLLGAILRIEPDPAAERAYGIPEANPYVSGGGAEEVWAVGVRNPWRIDLDDGWLYVADVGQNAYEEITVLPADAPAPNLGWPVMEGLHCYGPRDCDPTAFVAPAVEVEHGDAGTCSISGGVVYRGTLIPELAGHYLYSDFCGGWLRSFRWDGDAASDRRDWTSDVGRLDSVVGFGVDGAGEVYVLTAGAIHAVVPVREG